VVSWEVCARKAASSVRSWARSPLLANSGKAAAASNKAHQLKKPLPEQAELLMFGKKSAKSCSENHEAKLGLLQGPCACADADVVDGDDVVTAALVEEGGAVDVVAIALAVVEAGAAVVGSAVVVVATLAVVAEVPEHSQYGVLHGHQVCPSAHG
jgi:hypothetical protein